MAQGLPQGATRVKDIQNRELTVSQDGEAKTVNILERQLLEQILIAIYDLQKLMGGTPPATSDVAAVLKPVQDDLEYVWMGGRPLQVKWAEINATASGDTRVVASTQSARIRVIRLDLVVSAAVDVAWKSNVSGGVATTIRNAQSFAANSGMVWPTGPGWHSETKKGEDLYINLSATANVRGALSYVEVPAL